MIHLRRRTRLVLLVGALAALPVTSQAASPAPSSTAPVRGTEGLAWQPRSVRAPVAAADLRGVAPYVPDGVPQVAGPVRVGPKQGAALWLGPLDVVRVTGEPGTLRFVRVPAVSSAEAPHLRIEEEGVPERPGRWYLAEPMGEGSVWVVLATKPTRVLVERPGQDGSALVDEAVRGALLRWVDGQGPRPPLPFDARTRARLEVDAALEAELARGEPEGTPLRAALKAWRKASALKEWALVEPLHGQGVRVTRPEPGGTQVALEGMDVPWYQPPASVSEWAVELDGPGVLSLEVRPLLRGEDAAPFTVEVRSEGASLASTRVAPQPAFVDVDPDAAVPGARRPRLLASGERVGLEEEVRVALRPGTHAYRVRWEGNPVLLRARVASRRPTLGDALSREAHWSDHAARAWEQVKADRSPRAALLRQSLLALAPELGTETLEPGALEGFDGLPPLLRALGLVEAGDARAALTALRDADASPLAWHLRLRTARLLLDGGRTDAAHALLGAAPAFPESGWMAAEAAELVARLPLGDPLRSRELAALELAWRAEPLSEEIRRRYRAAWWRASRWSQVAPTSDEDGPAAQATRWLDLQAVDAGESSTASALWPLSAGGTTHVQATGPAEAPTLLRAYVLTPPRARGPLVLHVGTASFPLLPLSDVEPVEVALPPGEHALRLEGDAGARAFLSLAPARAQATPEEVGYVRTQWPVRVGKQAVRYRVPDARLPSPVRVQLRALSAGSAPVAVRMHTDVGAPRRLVLVPGLASARHQALEGARGTSPAPVSAVVSLPPLAREVWFEPEEASVTLFASLSVRRADPDNGAPRVDALLTLGRESPVDTLLALSRQLRESPDSAEPRLARAELLLALQEDVPARADVALLLNAQQRLTPEQSRRLLGLLDRLRDDAPESIRFTRAITTPTLVSPAFAALPGADAPELVARGAQAREAGAKRALENLPAVEGVAGRYLRARLMASAGQDLPAALSLVALYRETGLPQVGLEALGVLERLQASPEAWREGGAPLSAALAGQLQAWADHPDVRRMRWLSGRWTHWEGLRDAEQAAGLLQALSDGGADDEDLSSAVRKALLAPPWPLEQAQLLPAGQARVMSLDVRDARPLGAQVLCGTPPRVGSDGDEAPCTFALRVDGRTVEEQQVPAGASALLYTVLDTRGRHQVEVLLAHAKAPVTGLVRFVEPPAGGAEASALSAPRPLPLLRSRPGTPVVMTVLGPTALRVRAHALSPTAGRELLVRTTALPSGQGTGGAGNDAAEETPVHLGLPEDADPGLHGTAEPLGRAGETWLLLPTQGPHRVSLESPEGEALVQVQLGVTAPPSGTAQLRWWAQGSTGLEPLPWPALPPRLSLLPEGAPPAPPARGPGMLSAELAFRSEEVEEGELLNRPLRTGAEVRVSLRRELSPERAWLRFTPEARYPTGQSPVFGGSGALYLAKLPLDLRLSLQGAVFAQTLEDAMRWSARGKASVDRYVRLNPDLGLIPGLGMVLETTGGGTAVDASRYDQSVWWLYGKDHPRRLAPRLSLRWQPFQDHVGTVGTSATSNADLHTLDNAGGHLGWAALLGGPLKGTRAELGYGLSYRFQDEHRSAAYLRHRVSGRLDWNVWMGSGSRLMLFAEDRALLSGPYGLQNVFSVGARWDWTGGRGLRDVTPPEEEFEDLLDGGRFLD